MKTQQIEGSCTFVAHDSDAYWQTVGLRQELLRKPQGLALSDKELGEEADSQHLVYEMAGELAAGVVLQPLDKHRVKLRQMVVANKWQGQGIGRKLVQFAECWLVQQGYKEVVLHARTSAEAFYAGLGYEAAGEVFVEVGLPHQVMGKQLGV